MGGGLTAAGAANSGGASVTNGGGGAVAASGGSGATGGDGAGASLGSGGAGPERCTGRAQIDASSWKLTWSDEFDKDGPPNASNWGFEKGYVRNKELQWYQPDNASVSGGLLTIAAQNRPGMSPQYTSSSMTSAGKHSFLYGRFEMCGQIDTRKGSWPAFWILGNGRSWPASGEVDIMEYYTSGVRANVCKPSGGNCDWSGSVTQNLSSFGDAQWSSKFHLWAMEWSSTRIDLYLDDKLVYGYDITGQNPYTGNPFYIIVNQAIGSNGGDPSGTTFPISLQVDYVRVYQKP